MKDYYSVWHKGTSSISVLKGKCSICGDTINLQVHHLSYQPEIFVILCLGCHEEIHNHKTGFVQKNTKYGYEDFRAEHEESDIVRKYVETYIKDQRLLRKMFLKDKLLMKMLYGFGPIREKKEILEDDWKEITFLMIHFTEYYLSNIDSPLLFASLVEGLKNLDIKYKNVLTKIYTKRYHDKKKV